jgi:hypothetical protein
MDDSIALIAIITAGIWLTFTVIAIIARRKLAKGAHETYDDDDGDLIDEDPDDGHEHSRA